MGPKKDAKKKGGGKGDGPIVVDPSDFIREETDLQVLGGVSTLDTTLSGEFFNVEDLFPEWNEEEVWTDVPEALKSFPIVYPNIIKYAEEKSTAQLLGLKTEHESENKKGAKKPPKEFALDDAITSEEGIPLPRVFIGTDGAEESQQFLSSELNISFQKNWTSDQLERKAAMEAAYQASLPPAPVVVTEPPPSSASGARPAVKEPPGSKESTRPMSKDTKKPARAASPATAMKKPEVEVAAPVIPEPPKFLEQPSGVEVDPLLCHVFRLIARFYPSLCDPLGTSPPPFLWRAVYPQLPSGKPCYNKCGKYCVKLFVGGKWRKVTVTDLFPVQDGFRAIASSSNPLELWPSILAKAVYTAFTASGYQHTLYDLSSSPHRSNPTAISSFISFALHALTGWLPSTPLSLTELCDLNSPRLQTVLDEIALGGAVVINSSDIPSEEAIVMFSDEDNQNRQRTKKQLRDLLLRKKMEKENLIQDIHTREGVVETIQSALSRPFGEVYFLHGIGARPEPGKGPGEGEGQGQGQEDRILPILGICPPLNPSDDPLATKFLIQWTTSAMVFSQALGSEDVPGSTPVSYEWISLSDLCSSSSFQEVFLCSFDTRLRTPFSAHSSWHWGDPPEKTEEPKGGKGSKGKEKETKSKEKKTDATGGAGAAGGGGVLGMPSRGQDRGVFPPMLLKIHPQPLSETTTASASDLASTSGYFSLSVCLQSDLVLLPSPSPSPLDSTETENSSATGGASASAERQFGVIDDTVLILQELRPDAHLHDPLVMRVQLAKENLCFPINRITFNIPQHRLPFPSPSQEQAQEQQQGQVSEPVLFWVRLFTKSSVSLSFHAPVPIEVTDAKTIWQSTGGAVWELASTTVPTYAKAEQLLFRIPIQLIAPLPPAASSGNEALQQRQGEEQEQEEQASVLVFLHTSNRAITDTLSLVAIDHQTGHSRVLPSINGNCFHLPTQQSDSSQSPHSSKAPTVTLIARCFHSSLNIPEFSWKVTVLSRLPLVPPESKMGGSCLVSTGTAAAGGAGVGATKQRFFGSYAANNQLRIFRDILTAEATDFPLALRLSCLPLSETETEEGPGRGAGAETSINFRTEQSEADVTEHLWFIARVYRRADRVLVHEYSARSLLQIYLLEREGLTADSSAHEGEDPTASGAEKKPPKSAGGGKGGGEKKKKGGGGGEGEMIEFILEVTLDPTKMRIPPQWRSRFPFKFRKFQSRSELGDMDEKLQHLSNEAAGTGGATGGGAAAAGGGGGSPQEMQFHWQLDVLAGKVLKMQHDTSDLERYAALKNKWEDDAAAAGAGAAGRRARALAARAYWTTRTSAAAAGEVAAERKDKEQERQGKCYDDATIEKMATDLTEALEKDEAAVVARERQLRFLPQYREHHVPEPTPVATKAISEMKESTYTASLLSEEIVREEKEYLLSEIERWQDKATHHNDLLKSFHERYREDTLQRVQVIQEQASWSYQEAIQSWAMREAYRANVEKKNESLNVLLQRATEALITAFPGDFEDPKAAAKKKGKK